MAENRPLSSVALDAELRTVMISQRSLQESDGLGLLERIDLLLARRLAEIEILHHEIALRVELAVVVRQLLQLQHDVGAVVELQQPTPLGVGCCSSTTAP